MVTEPSLNEIIKDLFQNYLNFTNTIFNETLFVVSTTTQFYTLEELQGQEIYVTKGHTYKKYAAAILENNDIKAKFILTPTPVLYNSTFGVKISNSGGIAIGISPTYSELIPIIDRALNEEYRDKFLNSLHNINKKLGLYLEYCPNMVRHGVSFSVGFCQKNDSLTVTDAFKYADLAMFDAKNKKDFRYRIADEKFISSKQREESVFNVLKENIDGVFPVFQPKISLKTGEIIGAEALARYNSETLGVIPPFEFIPVAEKFNFVHKIDYAVADKAISFVKSELLKGRLPKDFRMSFNISVVTFKRADLILVLKTLLDKHDISGKYFEVEITESVFITDIQDLISKMTALSNLGFLISLDDFTAGHSTAGILPLIPLHIVKFDKSLLDSIELNRDRGTIVYKNLISLIKELNLKIVAEGVETLEQLQFLKEQGVDYAQGYYISKPVNIEEATLF
ncbi:EAL domain-containing protein [Cetobacterium sp. ZOR0034]|uniref:EAL domain-containing protein n=1 Tax=Cetobacterium sp. ZOR0034 TaxID=1339239 RepID=UPI0006488ACB|nr:EAL domain-containing protein [Cetobacterium sp. ZOR0034]